MTEAQNINVGRDLAGRDISSKTTEYSKEDVRKLFELLDEACKKKDKDKLLEFTEKITSETVSGLLTDFIFKLF